jgi:DNA-binding transcriptional regulator GbsR (MarR family)
MLFSSEQNEQKKLISCYQSIFMAVCSEEKKNLVEELGVFFERRHELPPLAARIYALLVLTGKEGYSFDNLKEFTQASKSSVSTNLNLLTSLKFLEFYTKTGFRKRYFRSSGSYISNMLNEHFDAIAKELVLVRKVNEYNKDHHPDKYNEKKYLGRIFQNFLETSKLNLEKTLNEIQSFQDNN